jgi:2-polyprenyl-3-methyl-5-hydroxy-6-metoxy-1,4-benzoquinol methylase
MGGGMPVMADTESVSSVGSCPACAGRGQSWATKGGHELRRCLGCSSIYVDPPDDVGSSEFYQHYHDRATFEAPHHVAAALERIARVAEPFRQTRRWLDMGYGEGTLLEVVAGRGWSCHGTEVSPRVLEHGRGQGWVVAQGTDDAALFPPASFDVVTMVELVEHVPAPTRFLADAARLLRPGGLLYITTPNANSLNRRHLGHSWSVVCPPEHLTLWSPRGLSLAVRRAGFRIESLRAEGLNPAEIVSSFRRSGGTAPPIDRNQAALALGAAMAASRPRRAAKAAINRVLSLLGLGDTLKLTAVRTAPNAPR